MSQRPPSFLSSSVGSKFLVGLTGLLLCGFLVSHLAGNLLLLGGAKTFNAYSHALTSNPLIYLAEAGLLAVFIVHVMLTVRLTLDNWKARPVAYGYKSPAGHTSRKGVASSTMIYTGLLVVLFVVLHLKHFKFGEEFTTQDGTMRDLFTTVRRYYAAGTGVLFYAVMMAVLGFHLWHGFSSAFQSLGVDHPRIGRGLVLLGRLFAVAIAGGYLVLPFWMHFHYKP